MSSRTEAVYQFVKSYITRHGYAPTRRNIGRGLKLSTSVVSYHLHKLQDEGRLTIAREVARGIVLTNTQIADEVARRGQPPDNADAPSGTRSSWQAANRMAAKG